MSNMAFSYFVPPKNDGSYSRCVHFNRTIRVAVRCLNCPEPEPKHLP